MAENPWMGLMDGYIAQLERIKAMRQDLAKIVVKAGRPLALHEMQNGWLRTEEMRLNRLITDCGKYSPQHEELVSVQAYDAS